MNDYIIFNEYLCKLNRMFNLRLQKYNLLFGQPQ